MGKSRKLRAAMGLGVATVAAAGALMVAAQGDTTAKESGAKSQALDLGANVRLSAAGGGGILGGLLG
ncbi:hypothetical protein AB0L74_33895 [Streptomyces sp. NPDC052020]|uniref:hypothetical protein n=1 Tax=Streptomyces sp. NPDC052020 TaxID=3155677 RepID=UPI003412C6FA